MASLILAAPVAAQTAPGDQDRDADNRDVIVVGSQSDRGVATSGTKTELPVAQTPQSISVVTSDDIAGLGLQNLNQVLRFVAGVTTEQRGSSAEVYDQFKLRGFDAPQFLDGLRLIGGASYLAPQVDVSLLDRVEVLKGPASVLYGQSGPGGLVALSSKMPLDRDMYGAIAGTYGTYDLYRIDADIGGRAGGDVLWRLYGSANGADTQQRFSKRVRQTVGGAVTAGAGTATSFTLIGRYSHDPDNGAYGVFPASGTFLTNPNGRLSTKFDAGEAGNRFQREQAAVSYIFNHDFGGGWALRSAGRYEHGTSQLGLVYANGTLLASDPTQQTFGRSSYATRENSNAWTYDTQLRGHVSTGPVEHTLLFGVDRQVGHGYSDYAFGSGTPLNGYAPVYGTMPVPQTPATVPDPFAGTSRLRARQQGLYAQDQISVGGLRVLLGGRQDWAQTGSAGQDLQHSRKFTYRAGALYTTSIGIAPYVSYSTSFEPQTGTVSDPNGTTDVPKPSQGKQIEAGIKYQVPNTSILLTGAWFRIEQTNLLTPIPNTPFAIQTGKVRSQGVEVEAVAPLPYGFNARLAFSRQKVRTIADENPANIGKGILGVGRGGTSANLEWAPQSGALSGFAIGGAVRHVDRVYAGTYFDASANAPDHTPSYTLFDALARYDLGKAFSGMQGVTLSVNATNLFDKKYITTCYLDYGWCWYGNRRTVQGTIGVRF
ncbi:iron complex outermembrane recepter protein [Sphingomonas gellani]|uniref:Iron complex outermembrane recepter protein n=2 Tax=Sphingomonas gellani TaxID=1166340 RepID=A0A1H8DJB9_9SPHN|nr:iron complex outermembrane recepter protein [Sphingomonas gellani]